MRVTVCALNRLALFLSSCLTRNARSIVDGSYLSSAQSIDDCVLLCNAIGYVRRVSSCRLRSIVDGSYLSSAESIDDCVLLCNAIAYERIVLSLVCHGKQNSSRLLA